MQELHYDEIDQVSGGVIPLVVYAAYFAGGAAAGGLVVLGAYLGYNEAKSAAK
jgi:lactobin A/cerein 7B family class IIb bacteriocin